MKELAFLPLFCLRHTCLESSSEALLLTHACNSNYEPLFDGTFLIVVTRIPIFRLTDTMNSLLDEIRSCICGFNSADEENGPLVEKKHVSAYTTSNRTPDEIATDVVALLRHAEKNDRRLKVELEDIVGIKSGSWALCVAKAIFSKLVELLLTNDTGKMGNAINDALQKVDEIAKTIYNFPRDHPVAVEVFCMVLAIGVLWFMLPWVLEVLGFAAEGPVAGKCIYVRREDTRSGSSGPISLMFMLKSRLLHGGRLRMLDIFQKALSSPFFRDLL